MGFTTPNFPAVEPEAFLASPFLERVKTLTLNWVDNGYGVPRMVHAIYIVKLVLFYVLGGVVVATLTSGLPAFWHVSQWWNEPIVYQKVILWTVLLETIGVAGSWGPLAGKTKPMMGGILYWARPGTIRLRPWRRVPFTSGNRRTWFDVALYLALIVSVIVPLVLPGVHSDSLSAALPDNTSGLVNPALLIVPMVLLVVIGLRDKTIFLAARGEQYLPALFFFTVLPFVDMIIALKLLIVVVWVGCRRLEIRPALHPCDPTDGEQQPDPSVQVGQAGPLPQLPERPASVAPRHLHGARAGHRRGNRCPAYPFALTVAVAHGDRGRDHGRVPSVHHFDVPDWRCRWNGTCCSPTRRSSCSSASRTGTATASPTCRRPG